MQKRLLDNNCSLAFVSSWTDFVGPDGEQLYTAKGSGFAIEPRNILDLDQPWGLADGPTSHPSVMFRADAYRAAGGYRAEFYYGQDWDLWYRLAEIGAFQMIPESLYVARFDPAAISSASREAQKMLAKLSLAAAKARAAGEPDATVLHQAAQVRRGTAPVCAEARGLYFIGELLRRNRDPRARQYFVRAIRSCPIHLKAWMRLVQTFAS